MADETDFIDLYGKLNLEPGCSLEDFKRAYRRNVAMWHPDRRRGSRADQLAAARLQRLTAQYGAAMDFHRRHGRLPGAPGSARMAESPPVETEPSMPVEAIVVTPTAASARTVAAATEHGGHARRWWLVPVAAVVGLLAWSLWPAEPVPEAEARQAPAPAVEEEAAPAPVLGLGMTPEEVLAIEGEPLRRGEDRWEYGPSWIRFERGEVTDWYSSPLRTLHTASTHPGR